MIEINLHRPTVNIVVEPSTLSRTLRFVDPESGITIRLDMPEESARELAAALTQAKIVPFPAAALPAAKVQH